MLCRVCRDRKEREHGTCREHGHAGAKSGDGAPSSGEHEVDEDEEQHDGHELCCVVALEAEAEQHSPGAVPSDIAAAETEYDAQIDREIEADGDHRYQPEAAERDAPGGDREEAAGRYADAPAVESRREQVEQWHRQ